MQAAFAMGLLSGTVLGIPLLSGSRTILSLTWRVGAILVAAFVSGQLDDLDVAFMRSVHLIDENPMFAVGFASGVVLVAIVRAAVRNSRDDVSQVKSALTTAVMETENEKSQADKGERDAAEVRQKADTAGSRRENSTLRI